MKRFISAVLVAGLVACGGTTTKDATNEAVERTVPGVRGLVPADMDGARRATLPALPKGSQVTTTTTFSLADLRPWVESVDAYAKDIRADKARKNAAGERRAEPTPVSVDASLTAPAATSRCPVESLIRSIWTQDADWAVSIAWRESNCRPEVTSPHGARGLFQLMPVHTSDACAYNAECNVRAAFALYQQCGRGPWSPPYYCTKP